MPVQTAFITPGVLLSPGSEITIRDKNRCPMHTHALKMNGRFNSGTHSEGCVRVPNRDASQKIIRMEFSWELYFQLGRSKHSLLTGHS